RRPRRAAARHAAVRPAAARRADPAGRAGSARPLARARRAVAGRLDRREPGRTAGAGPARLPRDGRDPPLARVPARLLRRDVLGGDRTPARPPARLGGGVERRRGAVRERPGTGMYPRAGRALPFPFASPLPL